MTTSASPRGTVAAYPAGQHLVCDCCGAELTVIKPCTGQPPDQVLRCCDRDLRPATPALPAEPIPTPVTTKDRSWWSNSEG